jgi:hypothetical protein
VQGDFQLTARLSEVREVNELAQVGLMARADLDTKAASLFVNGLVSSGRAENNSARLTATNWTGPVWMKLVRVQNALAGLVSKDGARWTLVTLNALGQTNRLLAGPAVTSNLKGSRTTATLDSLEFQPVSAPLVIDELTRPVLACAIGQNTDGSQLANLAFVAEPGFTLLIETSEDLLKWQLLDTLINEHGIGSAAEPISPTSSRRFFRARIETSRQP